VRQLARASGDTELHAASGGGIDAAVRLHVDAESPPFHIGTADEQFGPLARESVTYFQAHRDGAHQVSRLWQSASSVRAGEQSHSRRPGRSVFGVAAGT
jgi:hypothetical protein